MVRDLVRSLCVFFLVAVVADAASAAEPLGAQNFRNLWQTVQARKALADDPLLAHLNLGVHVKDGIAILWGPAPTVELAFRAEACLKALIELIDVRNQLDISPESLSPPPWNPPPRLPDRLPLRLPDTLRPPVPGRDPSRESLLA